ncbi:YqgE/AlgH family protein [Hoyosella rhizosphaerae]|uniref:YqgE/AlgH family protein n=1 Tax=Hoyosella rhizosphaerae TaxID=1755582 RepID=UPI001F120184
MIESVATWDESEDQRARFQRTVRPGSLLLASTNLLEPTFRRTVIYVVEHNDSGSLGVVLNCPSETAVHNVLPLWAPLTAQPHVLYIGGPVNREAALCLGTVRPGFSADGVKGLRQVEGRTVMIDLDADAEFLAPLLQGVRIFVGYAGWSASQLDAEIARGDWMVFPSLTADVLAHARIDLWARILRRQEGKLSMLATHPIELERN